MIYSNPSLLTQAEQEYYVNKTGMSSLMSKHYAMIRPILTLQARGLREQSTQSLFRHYRPSPRIGQT